MNKTDLEYISEKFAESGVNAPGQFNEAFVREAISGAEPLKVRKSRRKTVGVISAAAAAVAVVTAASVAVTGMLENLTFGKKPVTVSMAGTASLTSFFNRRDVQKALKNAIEFNTTLNGASSGDILEYADDGAAALSDSSKQFSSGSLEYGANSSHNATYVQEVGVDEADIVKTDGSYIYYLSDDAGITIFSADGKNSKQVGYIGVDDDQDDFGYCGVSDFYLYGNKLIALTNSCVQYDSPDMDLRQWFRKIRYGESYYYYADITEVKIYDISDIGNIRLTDSFSQSGVYCSSRMIDGMLYVVSTQYSESENDLPFVGERSSTADEASYDELPADSIYSVENPTESNFLVVSSINTDISAQATKTKAILGSAAEIYCNQDFLYVTAPEYRPATYYNVLNNTFSMENSIAYSLYADSTQIIKISLESDIDFVASANVTGSIGNQYALDEYDGKLRVATTSVNESGVEINNLFVLDKDLQKIGEVTGFAKNESIKAVRYVGETAYVITYEQTDPLFVIDVSDPAAPRITGEVKISGFSTLLVPVDGNTMLGIGYHTQDEADDGIDMEIQEGLKIVTFDVSDKSNPKVLDTKIFEDYSSQVQYNPKALLVNFERGDFTIPTEYFHWDDENDGENYYGDSYSGILNFRIDNGKIVIVDEYVSEKLSTDSVKYGSVDRCVYVGGDIYMLGMIYDESYDTFDDDYYHADIDCVAYR